MSVLNTDIYTNKLPSHILKGEIIAWHMYLSDSCLCDDNKDITDENIDKVNKYSEKIIKKYNLDRYDVYDLLFTFKTKFSRTLRRDKNTILITINTFFIEKEANEKT